MPEFARLSFPSYVPRIENILTSPVAKVDSGGAAGTYENTYDLGELRRIIEIVIEYGGTYASGVTEELYVYISVDGEEWEEIAHLYNFLGQSGTFKERIAVDGKMARYIKLVLTLDGNEQVYAQVNEIYTEIYKPVM